MELRGYKTSPAKIMEKIYEKICDQDLFGLLVISYEGNIVKTNSKMADILDTTQKEILEWTPFQFLDYIDDEDAEMIKERIAKRKEGEKVITNTECKAYKEDGTPIFLDLYSENIEINGDEHILVFFVDRTEKYESGLEIEENRRELDHLRNLIIHDILNHAQNILNAAELGNIYYEKNVGDKKCEKKCGDLFKIIKRNTQILNDLIGKIKR